MDFNDIIFESSEGISTIILNTPAQMNCFTVNMCNEIKKALEYAGSHKETQVIIITGTGRAFSVGGDIRDFASEMGAFDGIKYIESSSNLIRMMHLLDKPIISAVNGLAVGAGCNLAIAADLVIASENARFLQGFSKVGLAPDAGGTYYLPRLIGMHKAKEMAFTNKMFDAFEAEKIGLINRVVRHDDLGQASLELAKQIKKSSLPAIGITKLLFNRAFDSDLDNALAAEAYAQVMLMHTDDHREGTRAFLEKRIPQFTGK